MNLAYPTASKAAISSCLRLDELRLVVGPAPGGEDAVDPVAREGEHVLHVPGAQSLEQVVGNGW